MPKYKIDPIPGLPEWFVPGIVCRVRDREAEMWHGPVPIDSFIRECAVQARFLDSYHNRWRFAEPVEAWEPQEGEWVAAWNEGINDFVIKRYKQRLISSISSDHATLPCGIYRNVARLQYPDGRVIDCACSVEELKNRTEWI